MKPRKLLWTRHRAGYYTAGDYVLRRLGERWYLEYLDQMTASGETKEAMQKRAEQHAKERRDAR